MKLSVEPIYGWGWTNSSGQPIDVPAPFELEVRATKEEPFVGTAVGQLLGSPSHPLNGLWIRLSQRHKILDGDYNLVASIVEQTLNQAAADPKIMGFATARRVRE
jgi:hypothetical protein